MGWKDWSYWLKGGIIGSIAGLPLSILNFACAWAERGICQPINFIPRIFEQLLSGLTGSGGSYFVFFISGLFYYALLGILIGWVYGKIKNRNHIEQIEQS